MPLAGERPVVIGLARGGVPVASEVARALDAPLDVFAVRKLGAPGHPELAVGALAEERIGVLASEVAARVEMTQEDLDRVVERESADLERRVLAYWGAAPVSFGGRTTIVVDDGLATGFTVLAAIRAVRRGGAARTIVAAPVGSPEAIALLREDADRIVYVSVPQRLYGAGRYEDFSQSGSGAFEQKKGPVLANRPFPGAVTFPTPSLQCSLLADGGGRISGIHDSRAWGEGRSAPTGVRVSQDGAPWSPPMSDVRVGPDWAHRSSGHRDHPTRADLQAPGGRRLGSEHVRLRARRSGVHVGGGASGARRAARRANSTSRTRRATALPPARAETRSRCLRSAGGRDRRHQLRAAAGVHESLRACAARAGVAPWRAPVRAHGAGPGALRRRARRSQAGVRLLPGSSRRSGPSRSASA